MLFVFSNDWRDSLTKICYAFIGTVGKLKLFYTFFTLTIFKNIVVPNELANPATVVTEIQRQNKFSNEYLFWALIYT
jgi:hypothetical protein